MEKNSSQHQRQSWEGASTFLFFSFYSKKSLLLRVTRRHTPSFHRKLQQAKNEDGDKCVFKNTH